MKLIFGLIIFPVLLFSQNKIIGYFDNDDLKDYILKEKVTGDKITFSIFINNGKTYTKKLSFDVLNDDFSDIENPLDNLFITNPTKGEIAIGASCCGNFKSTEISYFKYYLSIKNWVLYKNSDSIVESDFLPTIEVNYLDFSYTIDDKKLNNNSIKSKELNDLKVKKENLFTSLFDKYKKANDSKTSNKIKGSLNFDELAEIIALIPMDNKNINKYNDLAYYVGQCKDGKTSSIFLLKEIIKKEPSRIVAYLNLGDAKWDFEQKEDAKESYNKYISLMKKQNKDLKKIPQRVYDRIK